MRYAQLLMIASIRALPCALPCRLMPAVPRYRPSTCRDVRPAVMTAAKHNFRARSANDNDMRFRHQQRPPSALFSPASERSNVDLPQPFGPSKMVIFPRGSKER